MPHVPILEIPQSGNSAGRIILSVPGHSVVIIGANGSGKTRLGAWFEFASSQQNLIRRIGAQKSLEFPSSVSPISLQDAEYSLDLGIDAEQFARNRGEFLRLPAEYRKDYKWNRNPETGFVNDYSNLLTYLISEQYEVSLKYTQEAKFHNIYVLPPETNIDRIKRIWEQILPHRELLLRASTVQVRPKGSDAAPYQASAMSDGERVVFYLVGQALAAPPNSILVIDEPEIHLHRVVQARLWDAVEHERPDCLFVYLTHDLDFAATRTEAKKLWMKSFDGQSWDWEEIPADAGTMPEALLLAVLGSRKPILFVEGQRGSLDRLFFSRIYPDWTIMPREGCDQVIETTKSFRALKHLHGLECCGIVDRDYRTPDQQATLATKGVYVLEMQEMENLLLIEPVLDLVASFAHTQSMTEDTPADIVRKAKERIFTVMRNNLATLAARKTAWELETKLHKIDASARTVAQLEQVRDNAAHFDVASTYTAFEQQLTTIDTQQDYPALLRIYNNKGLGAEISRYFGTDNYPNFVKRLISNGQGESIIATMRAAAPQLPSVASAI